MPTSETGTRHRTAERVARSLDVPVVSASEEMGVINVYAGGAKGVMARYVGGEWISEVPLTDEEFHGVWKHGEDVYFVGGNLNADPEDDNYRGVIVHYGPERGQQELPACE